MAVLIILIVLLVLAIVFFISYPIVKDKIFANKYNEIYSKSPVAQAYAGGLIGVHSNNEDGQRVALFGPPEVRLSAETGLCLYGKRRG